jgi:hypothetical protein
VKTRVGQAGLLLAYGQPSDCSGYRGESDGRLTDASTAFEDGIAFLIAMVAALASFAIT